MRGERAATVPFPPGETSFSLAARARFEHRPAAAPARAYERFGPVFTLKIFHHNAVFMLGAGGQPLHAGLPRQELLWRAGHMRDLIPLLGDGLLTIDGAFHRTHRKLMLPAFHRERIEAATDVMRGRGRRARWTSCGPASAIDLYDWTRGSRCASRCARCSGSTPTREGAAAERGRGVRGGAAFYGRDYLLQILRGPRTPFAQMMRARARLDALLYDEIDRRRASGERGEDILSLLLDATDEDGRAARRDAALRDEVMTLLFAGHDTTTSTVAFLFYELARNPEVRDRPGASTRRA